MPMVTGRGSPRHMAKSPCPWRIWPRSTKTRSGPGTPSASARAPGRWTKDAPEATKGFLLNHLIHELLPPKGDGLRWANSDPITGQAAWFDLRVKIEKVAAPTESQPGLPPIHSPVGQGPDHLRMEGGQMTQLPDRTEKKLGLVIDLDTCVGCHACVVSCKGWNTENYGAPLSDQDAYGARPVGHLPQPRAHLRGAARAGHCAARAFPEILPALRGRALRHRLPDGCQLQAGRGRDRAGQRD